MRKNRVYQFKITLLEITPPIWRRIQVPGTYTFWGLHVAIQDSMGWMDSHLHEFELKDAFTKDRVYIGMPDEDDYMDDRIVLKGWEEKIADYFTPDNKKAKYVYDFGDNWEHMVALEKILDCEKGKKYPVCLEGARACPPEDVGGIHGYEDFLKIINNPHHEEYESYLEWVSSQIEVKNEHQPCKKGDRCTKFNPEHFALEEIVFDNPAKRFRNSWN